jgi:hypothetical protein
MGTDAISPLRQRMIEDMNARKLCACSWAPVGWRGYVLEKRWRYGTLKSSTRARTRRARSNATSVRASARRRTFSLGRH